MSWSIQVGPTLSGGTAVVLQSSGQSPGKSTFTTPTSSFLQPEKVEITSNGGNALAADPGTVRTGLKVTFASRVQEEGCCTVMAGAVVADLGIRWNLNQPIVVLHALRDVLKAIVNDDEFWTAVETGRLPS